MKPEPPPQPPLHRPSQPPIKLSSLGRTSFELRTGKRSVFSSQDLRKIVTLKSDKHYVTICVGTYIQGCYFSCIAYYRNKGNRKKRRGLFQSMDPRLVSADGLEKPLILSYFIKKMRMCPTISSTSSMPM